MDAAENLTRICYLLRKTGLKQCGNRVHARNVLDLRIIKKCAGNEQDSLRVQPLGVRNAVKELTFLQPLYFTHKE